MGVVFQLSLGLLPGLVAISGSEPAGTSGLLAQAQQRFDSRPLSGPPTPAPRSSNSGTVILPRVPYDNRFDARRPYSRNGIRRRGPESQRVVPGFQNEPGDPVWYLDRPRSKRIECEWLRRLALRTERAYWKERLNGCLSR